MYASFQVPFFPLAVLLRDTLPEASDPTALVNPAADPSSGKESSHSIPVILAVNHAASQYQIIPGLTATRALARCPQLALLTPDPDAERRHQDALRQYVSSLGPDFEETAPGVFILDLLALPRSPGFPLDWIEQALRRAAPLRLPLHLALAPTPDLSLLAGGSSILRYTLSFNPEPLFRITSQPTFHLQHIASRSIASLCSGSYSIKLDRDVLSLWGIKTLGDLAALPRQGLAERLGFEAGRAHDILHGKRHRLLSLYRPPEKFSLYQDLEYPLENLEALLFSLNRGLGTLCSRLKSLHRATSSIKISLTFDDGNQYQHRLSLPEPSCHPSSLLEILQVHLETVHASAPIIRWSLRLTPVLPGETQHNIFGYSPRDSHSLPNTIAQLTALLGPDRLGVPLPLASHYPDSFRMTKPPLPGRNPKPSRETDADPTGSFSPGDPGTALPLSRYRPPLPVHVACNAGTRHPSPLALLNGPCPGPIVALNGPFPLSGNWWSSDKSWQRVEWDIQLADKTLLRLACHSPGSWTLEGSYQ